MKTLRILFALVSAVMATPCFSQAGQLWYRRPAQVWTDALPLGNGRLGAMVFGVPATERIQLNEETIWAGQPNTNANPDALKAIPEIQKLVFEHRYAEAEQLIKENVISHTNQGMCYQPFGDVYISTPGIDGYTDYRRSLSLDSAVATTTFNHDGVSYGRQVIASMADDVVMVRFTASRPGRVSFTANYATPQRDPLIQSVGHEAVMQGVSGSHEKCTGMVKYMGRMAVKTKGGKSSSINGQIVVEGADEAVLYIAIATNFNRYDDLSGDESARSEQALRKAMERPWAEAEADHVARFQKLMYRVSLSLGPDRYASLPTDERLDRFATTDDNAFVATYFNFGRYLLISSSQPGGQAANLQGIWNDKMKPAWDSKYTTNINLEMNYWPAESTNLPEMAEPLFKLINEVSQTGAATAKTMYGRPGWVLHHNTDLWRTTGAVDVPYSGMWMTGGAWLSAHLWQHYLFSGDKDFLARAYPVMKGAALFLDSMLVKDPESGRLVICPSVSPENGHTVAEPSAPDYLKGPRKSVAAGVTMDNELIFELFNSIISAARVLGTDEALARHYAERLRLIPPMQIGRWGQLQEWMKDWDNPNDTHRHVSHLYGLFPGNEISPRRTPELFEAARTSLIHRGDPSTGWSMGWKVCLWARLLDGNHAYKLIRNQLTLITGNDRKKQGGTYRNLFDAHPPFQIDGNFGCTAGISEMLLQSHDGVVELLPALPDAWKAEGEVKGLKARGGFEIADMAWKDGKIVRLTIKSDLGGNLRLRLPQALKGKKKARGVNPNAFFHLPDNPEVKNHSLEPVPVPELADTYSYDIRTKAGQTLKLVK